MQYIGQGTVLLGKRVREQSQRDHQVAHLNQPWSPAAGSRERSAQVRRAAGSGERRRSWNQRKVLRVARAVKQDQSEWDPSELKDRVPEQTAELLLQADVLAGPIKPGLRNLRGIPHWVRLQQESRDSGADQRSGPRRSLRSMEPLRLGPIQKVHQTPWETPLRKRLLQRGPRNQIPVQSRQLRAGIQVYPTGQIAPRLKVNQSARRIVQPSLQTSSRASIPDRAWRSNLLQNYEVRRKKVKLASMLAAEAEMHSDSGSRRAPETSKH